MLWFITFAYIYNYMQPYTRKAKSVHGTFQIVLFLYEHTF